MTAKVRRSRHSVLLEVAEIIKKKFVADVRAKQERLGRKGSRYSPGDKWNWERIAAFVCKHGLDIPPWVNYVVGEQRIPQPNHLLSPKILKRYEETAQRRASLDYDRTLVAFESEKKTADNELASVINSYEAGDFEQEMSERDLILSVMCNSMIALSDLFRFCWAMNRKMDDVADDYLIAAVCQYAIGSSNYDAVYADWLPKGFRVFAKSVYQVQ